MALDKNYLAGFFDGEGSIGVYARNKNKTKTQSYFVLVVSVAQSGMWGKQVLETLQQQWGGTVYKGKSSKKDMWKWNVSADLAKQFLLYIKDSLQLKKEEAELGIEFQNLASKVSTSSEALGIATKMKQCKIDY